jgi:uncharacterized protein (TIGR03435 family)
MRLIWICAALWILQPPHTQDQNVQRPQFEVASIKRNIDGVRFGFGPAPGGRLLVLNNATLNLIINAYNVRPYQIFGAPAWVNAEHYDMEAKAAGNPAPAQMMLMLQTLLEDRFKLKVHRETRELPVFVVTPAKGGIKLPPSTTNCVQYDPNVPARPRGADEKPLPFCNNILSGRGGNMRWSAQNIGIEQLIGALSSSMGRQVIDNTGFKGRFDLNLEYSPDPAPADATLPSIVTVLQEELGLKLDSSKGSVEILVIDHIERPSEN